MEELASDHDRGLTSVRVSSIPLVSVMGGDGRVIYTGNKRQLRGTSCNDWGRDVFSIIAKVGGYRLGDMGTLFVTMR